MDNKALEVLQRRVSREVAARKEAERLLEKKSLELYEVNLQLEQANSTLKSSLQDIEQDYRLIVERLNDVVYKIDGEGNFTFVNQAVIDILGYSSEEFLGRHFSELLNMAERENISAFYLDQIEKKETRSYKEIPVQDSSGNVRWFGQNVSLQYNEKGDFLGGVAVARDINEIIEARRALIDSEEKYRGLIEGMELGLMEVGLDGRIIKAYDWFCDMVGYSSEELHGKDADTLFLKEEDRVKMEANNAERMRGQAGVYEMEIRKKDGSFIWVAISGAPFYNIKDEIVGTIGVHLDISEQKALQAQLERANEDVKNARDAERKFFMNMSHEIRTPLNAVVGMTHLLASSKLNDKQYEMVQDLLYSSRMLQGLISNVLDLSKIEGGNIQPSLQSVDLKDNALKIVQIFQYVAETKNLRLTAQFDEIHGLLIETDAGMFNQILLNLISNAIKFTDKGSIIIKAAMLTENGGQFVSVEVTDTGSGIPLDDLDSIFDRNFRAKSSSSRVEGYGLGLAITKALISLLDGMISVTSEPNEGTTVKFQIPYIKAENAQRLSNKKAQEKEQSLIVHRSILVVEDNLMNQRYITRLLNAWNINFVISDTVESACKMLDQTNPSLILLDIQLPDGDGNQVAAYARKKNLKTPIIALTASAYVGHRNHTLSSGVDAYLTKPFSPEELRNVLLEFNSETTEISSGTQNDLTYQKLMRRSFLEETPKVLSEFRDAIDQSNLADQAAVLHKLIAMYGLIGEDICSNRCRLLEQKIIGKESTEKEVKELMKELKGVIEKLKLEA